MDEITPESITAYISATYPGVVIATIEDASFFSLTEDHWPNFATIVTSDAHDMGTPSDLARPGVFRLNVGVSGRTFRSMLGAAAAEGADVDYAAFDRLIPHPVYARQHWLGILNPSPATFETVVKPLLDEAHGLVARHTGR